jgi:asparagine synthase (glutamine-hydrolysing)
MCGIAGIVKLSRTEIVEEARLKRMRDVLRHRGPDGEGLWIEGPVGLGHRRLAIVDVAGGDQPMTTENGRAWIVYNGEIYNHLELRAMLEARGHRYRTRSDTETILHLYEEEGERCVERLRGMFAFAIWDRARQRLFLARDRLGIKPLYVASTAHEFLFASEIKAILAAMPGRPRFNREVLPEYLASRFVAGEQTFFQGIVKLLPGHTISWSPGEPISPRRYWRLPERLDESSGTLALEGRRVRDELEAAVRSHLMSDVPLGLFLSGGIDSSGIAALMAPMMKEPLRTFAVGFAEPGADETGYARLAAQRVGAEHCDIIASPAEFFHALPRLVWHEDEPIAFPSSVPLYFVARLARDHVKVVLTGEGADELFLGYNRYRVTAWNERLHRVYGALVPRPLREAVRHGTDRLPASVRHYAGRTFLAVPPGPRALFFENFAAFPVARQQELLADPRLLADHDPYAVALDCYERAPGGSLTRMSYADLETYLVELLMKQDQMSMAASVESRVPFLDHELVERVARMPTSLKLRGWRTKAVLRSALRDLVPKEILVRRKMGFPVPVGRWLRGDFRSLAQEFVQGPRAQSRGLFEPAALSRLCAEHADGTADHGDRLWLLMNLEMWQRIFIDGDDPQSLVSETGCTSSG